jgi:O-antigen ligase
MKDSLTCGCKIQDWLEQASKIFALVTIFCLPLSTTLADIFLLITVVATLSSGNFYEKIAAIWHNQVARAFVVFFCLFVVGVIYSTAPLGDALAMLSKYDKLLLAAPLMLVFTEDKWRNHAITVFLVAIAISVLLAYLKFWGLINYSNWDGSDEIFKGHIEFSFLLSFTVYLILLEFERVKDNRKRILLGVFIALLVYEILFIGTGRAGYFILAGLVLLFFAQKMHWRGVLLAVIVILLMFFVAFNFSSTFKNRMQLAVSEMVSYQEDQITSMGLRISFAKNSLKLIEQHPIIGTGTGSFKYEYAKITPTPTVLTHNPHNEYLHIGVQFGLVGLLMLLALFVIQFRLSFKLPQKMCFIAQATVLSIVVGCLANSWLMDTTQGHFYIYFMALTFSLLPRQGQAPHDRVK